MMDVKLEIEAVIGRPSADTAAIFIPGKDQLTECAASETLVYEGWRVVSRDPWHRRMVTPASYWLQELRPPSLDQCLIEKCMTTTAEKSLKFSACLYHLVMLKNI